ncbi:MAG: glycosyltransferase family 39 protein [Caldilineales bacterium]|nr:glycosyltransferase family 39 protein [Caldilineales bacterium]
MHTKSISPISARLILLAASALLAVLLTVLPWTGLRYACTFIFLWILPGPAWVSLVPASHARPAERAAIGLGLSFVITPITVLALSYLPGPLSGSEILAAMVMMTALPVIASLLLLRRNRAKVESDKMDAASEKKLWQRPWFWLAAALLLAIGLRTINLDYSEFQGDEAIIMIRAARVLQGEDGVIFEAKKPAAQYALIMAQWRLTGVHNELMARLPFAWISVVGLFGIFLVGRRLRSPWLGALAVALLAIDGYLVGFGRIVQYQSIVFALTTLALLCLLIYFKRGHAELVLIAAALFAGAFLSHYDAALALPAGIFLILARFWQDRDHIGRALIPVGLAGLLGLALIAIFFVPFYRSPWVGYTSAYIASRVGGTFGNNLRDTFVLSTVYNSIYYLALLLAGLLASILISWSKWGRTGLAAAVALILLAITTYIWPGVWVLGSVTLAGLPFVALLGGALLAPAQTMERRALWVWFSTPFIFYLFVVDVPWSHVHTFFPPWAILAAWGGLGVWNWLRRRQRGLRWAGLAAGAALYLLAAVYILIMFVSHSPEYRRTFPASQLALYPTPYEQIPEAGIFGFPYRAGWKTVGALFDLDMLSGTYNSNEEPHITDYYTRHADRQFCLTPDMYITAVNVQDEIAIEWSQVESQYSPAMQALVGGEPKLTVHRLGSLDRPQFLRVEDYEAAFDAGTTPARVAAVHEPIGLTMPDGVIPQDFVVGDFARLVGYSLDAGEAHPGGYVDLVLVWEALQTPAIDYTIFNHLHDGMVMRGQLDGKPACGARPTVGWQPGEIIVDPHRIPINPDSPVGPVPLRVGMYDLLTMQRAAVSSGLGEPLGDSVYLTDVVIEPQP